MHLILTYATNYLAKLVKEHNLPPKVFIVHRFTQAMVKNYQDIKRIPEVQFVLHMDGWGPPELKKGTYRHFIHPEPIEYTGFKIFYKNDIKAAPNRLITPEELLALTSYSNLYTIPVNIKNLFEIETSVKGNKRKQKRVAL